MKRCTREITKDIYDRAQDHNGFIIGDDMSQVFSEAELIGYGVYSPIVCEKDDRYYVNFELGDSCD